MEIQKFFWLSRRYHVIDNPTSEAKIDEVVARLRLGSGSCLLDIGCGKAEMLCRIAAKYGASCVGVERHPRFCEEAAQRAKERNVAQLVSIENVPGQDFRSDDASFGVSTCIGASWILGGLEGTLAQLSRWTKPGGQVVVGDIFWSAKPTPEYLQTTGMSETSASSHAGNVALGEAHGLELSYTVVSSQDDWDRYTSLSWQACLDYCLEHPDDPDVAEIKERTLRDQVAHIRQGGRDCLGWALYVFNRP